MTLTDKQINLAQNQRGVGVVRDPEHVPGRQQQSDPHAREEATGLEDPPTDRAEHPAQGSEEASLCRPRRRRPPALEVPHRRRLL